MKTLSATLCLLLLAGTPSLSTLAQTPSGKPAGPDIDDMMIKAGFLSSHPDLRYRLLGLDEMKAKQYEDAMKFFQRAGYYSDKPSQGMVAEMYWNGQGTPRDPALAYAWMDLAAERGYEGFVVLRERYWKELSEPERARALQEGQALYARYGDAAAQPRLATVLRRERRKVTGSRTGFAGTLQIMVPGPGGMEQIDGTKFYDEKFWDPEQYQAWHDGIWKKPRVGRVTVGELENASGPLPASRIPATTPEQDAQEPETPEVDEARPGTRKDG